MTRLNSLANYISTKFLKKSVGKFQSHIKTSEFTLVMTLVISSVVFLNHLSHFIHNSEKAAAELKKRLESVDSENRILTRKSSIDTSNFPKEILRQSSSGYGESGYGGSRRRSSTKETDIKPERYLERYAKSGLRPKSVPRSLA